MLPKLDLIEELIDSKMNEAKTYSDDNLKEAVEKLTEKYDTLMSNLEKDCIYKIE
jgi:hypothetical protein|tara:strand:- start:337 stop:501 length:165 start_codon:yes stop_codon:yes gene_type:complete